MAKYFVHEGLQFQTITVPYSTFSGFASNSNDVEAVTLNSVATALTTIVGNLAALEALWDESGITDTFQKFSRELLNETAALVSGNPTDGGMAGTPPYKVHDLSYQWILPRGLSLGMTDLPGEMADASDARNRIVVKSLEVSHTNIKKHTSAALAWEAWIAYEIATESQQGLSNASRAYLINPTT